MYVYACRERERAIKHIIVTFICCVVLCHILCHPLSFSAGLTEHFRKASKLHVIKCRNSAMALQAHLRST